MRKRGGGGAAREEPVLIRVPAALRAAAERSGHGGRRRVLGECGRVARVGELARVRKRVRGRAVLEFPAREEE